MSCQIDDGIAKIMGRTLEHLHSKPACDLPRFTMLAKHLESRRHAICGQQDAGMKSQPHQAPHLLG